MWTSGDVSNILVEPFAAGTFVLYTRFPLGKKSIDTTTPRDMLGKPVSKCGGELFKGCREHIPVDIVKVIFVNQLFSSFAETKNLLRHTSPVM